MSRPYCSSRAFTTSTEGCSRPEMSCAGLPGARWIMKKFKAMIRRTMGTILRLLLMIYLAKEDKVTPPEKNRRGDPSGLRKDRP
ncbi:protein of unknown function [Mesotoga infera]|uniref:Uncharacterized protein n=1 Tax=Mesotoga infera TaxID=1236046 RepID=A0A7Z7LFD4_9BACT|nr:protein of unknown function [Mesotoga infera]